MNNYSWLEQKLHKFALSSNFMREVAFDFENSLTATDHYDDDHVFISGLARSGTTILLNAIFESGKYASLSYADMPFIMAPNLWSKIHFHKTKINPMERSHGDKIKISSESPEAFEEVFWKTFDQNEVESHDRFKQFVNLINKKYEKRRYISKNNQNIRRLAVISEIFPNSKILIPFRQPIQQAYSLLTQHKKFIKDSRKDKFISDYMYWIGHTEFGPNYAPIHDQDLLFGNDLDINHWLEQWYLTYKEILENYCNQKNFYPICYETLCQVRHYWFENMEILGINEKYDFTFKASIKDINIDINNELNEKTQVIYDQLKSI